MAIDGSTAKIPNIHTNPNAPPVNQATELADIGKFRRK